MTPHISRKSALLAAAIVLAVPASIQMSRPARALLKGLSSWRYATGVYARPFELNLAQKLVRPRNPKVESL